MLLVVRQTLAKPVVQQVRGKGGGRGKKSDDDAEQEAFRCNIERALPPLKDRSPVDRSSAARARKPPPSGTVPPPAEVSDALADASTRISEFFGESKFSLANLVRSNQVPAHVASKLMGDKVKLYQGSRTVVSLVQAPALYRQLEHPAQYPSPRQIEEAVEKLTRQFSNADGRVDDEKLEGAIQKHQASHTPDSPLASATTSRDVAEMMAAKVDKDQGLASAASSPLLGAVNEISVPIGCVLVPAEQPHGEEEVLALLFAEVEGNSTNRPIAQDEIVPEGLGADNLKDLKRPYPPDH